MRETYLSHLFYAFERVDPRYYFAEVFRDMNFYSPEQDPVMQTTENSFSAEIFSNWRSIMRQRTRSYNGLALDFDVRKDWFDQNIFEYPVQSYRPDLVLHASQLIWEPEFQKIYVEVKTHAKPFLMDDVRKMMNAQIRLQFEHCVFISVNSHLDRLTDSLRDIIRDESKRLASYDLETDWSRMHLFHAVVVDGQRVISRPIRFSELQNGKPQKHTRQHP